MKLSTKGRYGLMAMYEVGISGDAPISIKSISASHEISEAYLEQLLALLKKAGLVNSTRGAQGGYVLSQPAQEITIGEILRALEGSTNITDCIGESQCGSQCSCVSRPVFEAIQSGIDSVLNTMTLQDMIRGSL